MSLLRSELRLDRTFTDTADPDRSMIHSFSGKLRRKPLLDMVGGIFEDYEFLWDQYYFSTATL